MRFIKELNALLRSCTVHYLTEKDDFYSPDFELVGILEGHASLLSDAVLYKEGAVLLLPPFTKTVIEPEGSCILLNLSLAPELLYDVLDKEELFLKPAVFQDAVGLFSHMAQYALFSCQESSPDPYQESSLLLPLLGKLAKLYPLTEQLPPSPEIMTQKQIQFLSEILGYVQENYRDELSLGETAAHFQVTPQYFANFFKKFMNQTFHQYVQNVRCQKGCIYLAVTSLTPEEIYGRVGLNQAGPLLQYAALIRLTPKASVSRNALSSLLPPDSAKTYLSRFAGYASEKKTSEALPCVVEADVSEDTAFTASWRRLINLGYASDFSSIQIFNQLIRTQKEIGFSYGRICRLFDLVTEYTVGTRTLYDYNRIFRLLDVMIEHDMLPFLELSNKLFRIQLNLLETVPINLNKDSSAYYERLMEFLPDFLRSCINRYGQDCVDQWRFEISYTNYDFVESAENFPLMKYVRYFRRIKEIIRAYSPRCQVGGPGFNYWKSPQRLAEIFSLFSANQTMPDFVSAYIYPLTSDDAQASLSTNENLTIERLCALRDVARGPFPDIEIWITEFNSNLSSRNMLNDSAYQAAFLAKTLAAAAGLGIQAMGYYLLSDVPLRYVDSLDLLFGGWGLFTDQDIPKPSYHAYRLLAQMGSYLLKNEAPYILTCHSNYSFQCLFYHYEHITPDFCQKNVSIRDFNRPEDIFLRSPSKTFEVRLNGVRPGTYLVKEYVISGEESNILAQWRKIGCLNLSKPNDIQALKLDSQLIPKMRTIEVRPGQPLTIQTVPGRQEVRLLKIDLISSVHTLNKEAD